MTINQSVKNDYIVNQIMSRIEELSVASYKDVKDIFLDYLSSLDLIIVEADSVLEFKLNECEVM